MNGITTTARLTAPRRSEEFVTPSIA